MSLIEKPSKLKAETISPSPPGWIETRIGEICTLNPGLLNLPEDDTLVSFVPMAAVSDEFGTITQAEVRPFREVRRGYSQFKDGDVIFAKITPCMENGKAAVAYSLENGVGCGSTEFYVLRPNEAIVPEFLHRYLRQQSFREVAKTAMRGAGGHTRVPKEHLLETIIPLPPLEEQRRILAELAKLEHKAQDARARLADVPVQLGETRRSLLMQAFIGALTEDWRPKVCKETGNSIVENCRADRQKQWELMQLAPDGSPPKSANWKSRYKAAEPPDAPPGISIPTTWAWIAAEEATQPGRPIVYGIIKPGPHVPDGVPYVRVAEMKTGTIDVPSLRRAHPNRAALFERATLKAGDILISKDGTVGKVALVPPELEGGNITQHVLRLSPSPRIFNRYLTLMLEAPVIQEWLQINKTGVALEGINVTDFRRLALPIPPIEEQHEIVRRLDEALHRLAVAATAHAAAISNLDQLEQSLLAQAFRGQLVPQRATDQPAQEILARIQASAVNHPSKVRKHMPRKNKSSAAQSVRSIIDVLDKSPKGLTPEQLFYQSGRSEADLEQVEKFYAEIRQLVRDKKIIETRPTNASVILTAKP